MGKTEQKVRNLLMSIYNENGRKPVTTREILESLDRTVQKHRVNNLLYNSGLHLDRIFDLCKIDGSKKKSAPSWYIEKKKCLYESYSGVIRLGWTVYEEVRDGKEKKGDCFPKHIRERLLEEGVDSIKKVLSAHVLLPQETIHIDVSENPFYPEEWIFRYENNKPTLAGYVLNCDDVSNGRRGEEESIMLGMAIQEFIARYPTNQELVLHTKRESLYNTLRHLLETVDVLRKYNITVIMVNKSLVDMLVEDNGTTSSMKTIVKEELTTSSEEDNVVKDTNVINPNPPDDEM